MESRQSKNAGVYRQTFRTGLWDENPVLRLLLGMCPTLAVTAAVKPALTMGYSVIFVLLCSNIVVSLMRGFFKPHVRILMFALTIATFVTIVDLFLQAFQPQMSTTLGPYVPLIIVNCIIMCRAEVCASRNPVFLSIVDALGMGVGFTVTLCILAGIRELLSTGAVFGIQVIALAENGGWFRPWAAMRMPVGAFVALGLLLGLMNIISRRKEQKK